MRNIEEYMDLAREQQGIPSDRKLAAHLGLGVQTTNFWRTGRSLPSDDAMIKLAEAAKVPAKVALCDLAFWRTARTNQPAAAQVFKSLSDQLMKASAALILLGFSALPMLDNAGTAAIATATHFIL